MVTIPESRMFVPLAESPLTAAPRPDAEYTDLAVRLAEHAPPGLAILTRLLAITYPGAAGRIGDAFDARDDLSPDARALLVASLPGPASGRRSPV
jgi:hypothetical protein